MKFAMARSAVSNRSGDSVTASDGSASMTDFHVLEASTSPRTSPA